MTTKFIVHRPWALLQSSACLVTPILLLFIAACTNHYNQHIVQGSNTEKSSPNFSDETNSESVISDKKGKRKKLSQTRSIRKKVTEEEDAAFLKAWRTNDIYGLKSHFRSFKDAKMAPDSKEAQYLMIAITRILILEAKETLKENDHERIKAIQELLDHPLCDINKKGSKGSAPIHQAVLFDNVGLVHMLLRVKGIDLSQVDETGVAPIHRAIMHGNADILDMLLQAEGINVNLLDKYGFAPIHRAIKIYRSELVPMLLEQKDIDLSILDSKGIPLMRYLMRFYNADIWSAFMDGPITKLDVNARHPDGYTTLHYALCYAGDPEQAPMEAVLRLLDHKDIHVNVVARNFATPLATLLFNKNFNEDLCLKLLNHKKLRQLEVDYTTERLFAYVVGNTEGKDLLKKWPSSSNQLLRSLEWNCLILRMGYFIRTTRNKLRFPEPTQCDTHHFVDLKTFTERFEMVHKKVTSTKKVFERRETGGITLPLRRSATVG